MEQALDNLRRRVSESATAFAELREAMAWRAQRGRGDTSRPYGTNAFTHKPSAVIGASPPLEKCWIKVAILSIQRFGEQAAKGQS